MEHHVHLDDKACRMCIERENDLERLRELLREIYDCADDWNRVEDLANEGLKTSPP